MAVLHLVDGRWVIDGTLTPMEFWPYTTFVQDVIVEMPFDTAIIELENYLMKEFVRAGIPAYVDNKIAFGMMDDDGKTWYFGFKDCSFRLGKSVSSHDHTKPVTKKLT